MGCKYFLPLCYLSLHPLNSVFQRANIFNFIEVQCIDFLLWIILLVSHLRSQDLGPKDFLLLFFQKFYLISTFTFESLIHLS